MRSDTWYMKRAFSLARKGAGRVYPNPLVGCVIVHNRRIVGQGYHARFGGPHAEAAALAQAGSRSRGGTLYVNLEPCDHWGKTPPCTAAIIAAGIRTVVAAMKDPNPRTNGRGLATLARHGVAVVTDVLTREAEELNVAYRRACTAPERLVTVKAAMSLDGKIATRTGDSRWITGPKARAYGHRLRAEHDAILAGITTVLRDDPSLTAHGAGKNPVRVIIDPHLRTPLSAQVLNEAAATVIIYTNASAARRQALAARNAILIPVTARKNRIPFGAIVDALAGIGIHRILVEGGGTTIAAAVESGLVNRVALLYAPLLIGGAQAPTGCDGTGSATIATAVPLQQVTCRTLGKDLLVTGTLHPRKNHVHRPH